MIRVDSTDRRSLDIALPVAERQGYLDGNPFLNGFRWGTTNERLHPGEAAPALRKLPSTRANTSVPFSKRVAPPPPVVIPWLLVEEGMKPFGQVFGWEQESPSYNSGHFTPQRTSVAMWTVSIRCEGLGR